LSALPSVQHNEYIYMNVNQAKIDPNVHSFTQHYFS
jgi:hypothetical protein